MTQSIIQCREHPVPYPGCKTCLIADVLRAAREYNIEMTPETAAEIVAQDEFENSREVRQFGQTMGGNRHD